MERREAEEKIAWPNLKIKLALVPMDPGTSCMAIWWKVDVVAAAAVAWSGIEIPVASLKWWQRWWYCQWRRYRSCWGPPLFPGLFILVTSVFNFESLPGRNHHQTPIDNLVVMYSNMGITCIDLEEFASQNVALLISEFWDVRPFWGKDGVLRRRRSPWVVRLCATSDARDQTTRLCLQFFFCRFLALSLSPENSSLT